MKGLQKQECFVHGEQNAGHAEGQKVTKTPLSNRFLAVENSKKSPHISKRAWKLSIKICVDVNRDSFLFQCQMHINAFKMLVLTGALL